MIVSGIARDDAVEKIFAIEAADVNAGIVEAQVRNDIGANAFSGGGGERHERSFWEKVAQCGKLAIFGTEIVAPFTDAMGFVDGDEGGLPFFEIVEEAGEHEAFGRDVEEFERIVVQAAKAFFGFVGGEGGIEAGREDAAGGELIDLIFHQRDQRRNDDSQAVVEDGGKLEAERFAAAGGQEREGVAAGEDVGDDFLLVRAK